MRFYFYYAIIMLITVLTLRVLSDKLYEWSYDWIGCGEALHRQNNSAAPRDTKEVNQWNECLFRGIKKWPK